MRPVFQSRQGYHRHLCCAVSRMDGYHRAVGANLSMAFLDCRMPLVVRGVEPPVSSRDGDQMSRASLCHYLQKRLFFLPFFVPPLIIVGPWPCPRNDAFTLVPSAQLDRLTRHRSASTDCDDVALVIENFDRMIVYMHDSGCRTGKLVGPRITAFLLIH